MAKPNQQQKPQQQPPGTEAAMQPKPDHGETSYRGCGRLAGKVSLITGADSVQRNGVPAKGGAEPGNDEVSLSATTQNYPGQQCASAGTTV